jgi:hypothetical protein
MNQSNTPHSLQRTQGIPCRLIAAGIASELIIVRVRIVTTPDLHFRTGDLLAANSSQRDVKSAESPRNAFMIASYQKLLPHPDTDTYMGDDEKDIRYHRVCSTATPCLNCWFRVSIDSPSATPPCHPFAPDATVAATTASGCACACVACIPEDCETWPP